MNVPAGPTDLSNPMTDVGPQKQMMVPVRKPSVMGRVLEVASGGAYDPTGGEDTTNPPMTGWGNPNGPTARVTKYGALAKVMGTMIHGAAIGGFLGKSHPGGGFGAANDYYQQQRMRQMQFANFMQQMQLNQSTIAKNQAEAQWAQRRPLVTRTGPAIKGKDEQGNDIYLTQNPTTGVYEKQEGVSPAPGPVKEVPTDQGLVTYDPANPQKGAVPLTLAQQASSAQREGSAESASEPSQRAQGTKVPTKFDSGSPRAAVSTSPGASPNAIAASGGVPLRPPGFNTPRATVRASRNGAGVETDNIYDTNPNSQTFGQRIGATGNTRQPVPDRTAGREGARDAQRNADAADVERYAGAALAQSSNDPDKAIQSLNNLKVSDPQAAQRFARLLPQIRKSIGDRMKSRKPKAKIPFGLSEQDWNAITQPVQDQPEQ